MLYARELFPDTLPPLLLHAEVGAPSAPLLHVTSRLSPRLLLPLVSSASTAATLNSRTILLRVPKSSFASNIARKSHLFSLTTYDFAIARARDARQPLSSATTASLASSCLHTRRQRYRMVSVEEKHHGDLRR